MIRQLNRAYQVESFHFRCLTRSGNLLPLPTGSSPPNHRQPPRERIRAGDREHQEGAPQFTFTNHLHQRRLDIGGDGQLHCGHSSLHFPTVEEVQPHNCFLQDPLKWWHDNEAEFPAVARIARDYMSMLASSVPSEAAFSAAGRLVTDQRTSLDSSTVQNLMLRGSWLKYQRKLEAES